MAKINGKNYKKTTSNRRRLSSYPSEHYFLLFRAFFHGKQTDSKAIDMLIRKFFEQFTDAEKSDIIAKYNKKKKL